MGTADGANVSFFLCIFGNALTNDIKNLNNIYKYSVSLAAQGFERFNIEYYTIHNINLSIVHLYFIQLLSSIFPNTFPTLFHGGFFQNLLGAGIVSILSSKKERTHFRVFFFRKDF